MPVYGARLHVAWKPPHVAEDLLARRRTSAVEEQVAQQSKFQVGQRDRFALAGDRLVLEVHLQPSHEIRSRLVLRLILAAAKDRLHTGEKLLRRKRLGEVVVGAELKAAHLVLMAAEPGEHENRGAHAPGASLTQHVEAAAAGKLRVQDDQAEPRQ